MQESTWKSAGESISYLFSLWVLTTRINLLKRNGEGFAGGAVVKNPPANAGDTGSIPGP